MKKLFTLILLAAALCAAPAQDIKIPQIGVTPVAEASSNPSVDDGTAITAGGANLRQYSGSFVLPTTEKFYFITGIEWKNGATSSSLSQCGVSIVDATPPSAANIAEVAWGMVVNNGTINAIQRNSSIVSVMIPGGTRIAGWVQSGGTTHIYKGETVSSNNYRKAITLGTQSLIDTTAWTATTLRPYMKVYYVGYK